MFNRIILLAAVGVVSTGCAIKQNIKPVERFTDRTVCIVDNPEVREGFMEAYQQALQSKGYIAQKVAANSPVTQCPITSTYTANWSWGLAIYMSYADIKVYNNGKQVGGAVYDSTNGRMNTKKFIEADKKIKELVDQLFQTAAVS